MELGGSFRHPLLEGASPCQTTVTALPFALDAAEHVSVEECRGEDDDETKQDGRGPTRLAPAGIDAHGARHRGSEQHHRRILSDGGEEQHEEVQEKEVGAGCARREERPSDPRSVDHEKRRRHPRREQHASRDRREHDVGHEGRRDGERLRGSDGTLLLDSC